MDKSEEILQIFREKEIKDKESEEKVNLVMRLAISLGFGLLCSYIFGFSWETLFVATLFPLALMGLLKGEWYE